MRAQLLALVLALAAGNAQAAVSGVKSGQTESSPTLAWREWKMDAASPRQAFRDSIGPLCATDPRTRIVAKGARVRVLETRGCAEQLERLALEFQKRARTGIPAQVFHLIRVPGELWAPAAAMVGQMARDLSPEEFSFAAPTTACGCLAFAGKVQKPGEPPVVDTLRAKFDARFLSVTGSAVPGNRWELPLH